MRNCAVQHQGPFMWQAGWSYLICRCLPVFKNLYRYASMLTRRNPASSHALALTGRLSGSNDLLSFTSVHNCQIKARHFCQRDTSFLECHALRHATHSHTHTHTRHTSPKSTTICWRRSYTLLITHGVYSQPQIPHRSILQTNCY